MSVLLFRQIYIYTYIYGVSCLKNNFDKLFHCCALFEKHLHKWFLSALIDCETILLNVPESKIIRVFIYLYIYMYISTYAYIYICIS